MGLIRALVRAQHGPADDFWYQPLGVGSAAGINVTAEASLSASPVWGAVRLLAESIASLPLIIYQRLPDGGKERAVTHPIYQLLHDQPNPLQTAFAFRRVMMVWALLYGNAYAEIRPGPRGVVDSLWPLHPDGVRLDRLPDGGVRYMVRGSNGQEQPLLDDEVFHLPGLSLDGASGLSVMHLARESIGVNLAAKLYSAEFFGGAQQPLGVLKVPGKLGPEGRENLREYWAERHQGVGNRHRPAVLQDGVEWVQTGMTNQDATLIGTLEWSAADCARFFNVPLHLLQETSKVTSWGSGIEELNGAFVTYSLLPWLTNWQQTIAKDLIMASRVYFAEFMVEALLRGKTLDRYQAYSIAAGGPAPWLTRNEVRERENLNKLPGLDEPILPLNMGGAQTAPDSAPAGQETASAGAQLYLRLFAREQAGRIVRREMVAMDRAATRAGQDRAAWMLAVDEFYGKHAGFVADTLHLSPETAERYAMEQRGSLLEQGPLLLCPEWEAESVERLAALTLEGRK